MQRQRGLPLIATAVVGVTFSLLLAACGTVPSGTSANGVDQTQRQAAAPAAPPRRDALLAAAQAEWDFFGEQQIDMRHEPLSAPRLGLLEDEGEAVQRIAQYWQAVGRNYTGADTQQPWSAAFISYLMLRAGVPNQDFGFSETHFDYLSFLKERENQPRPLFVLRSAATEPITPGDLLCASRENNAVSSIEDIRPGLPGHCDLVFELHAEQGWAGVIGGNVFNSVSESFIPISSDGRALPTARRPWFVVVKNLMP